LLDELKKRIRKLTPKSVKGSAPKRQS